MDHIDHSDFLKGKLEGASHNDPMAMFEEWYAEVKDNECSEPQSVVFTTASASGMPASRVVYLRGLEEEGMIVYTNYQSRKGEEVMENPNVALLFYWDCMERQVRIEGSIEKVDSAISDAYFANRPRVSQIGAWASDQSSQIENRAALEERVRFFEEKFPNEVPRPPHWGGFLIRPKYYEFWQGRKGRLHDRICFEQTTDQKTWKIFRIAP